ncbi:mannose-1-phosphate guanylyltransferase/mannose-6-phosphate isomerase [Ammonifex degensii KC4]|uniref:mannose-1-phosphate guanylyltransferase n=1 Tax=Ammonifex degensii (strain DSM 10501 / KC4) TaxID=429009 RepID=C9RBL8_AMMDK|nr:mannose-1-phosphate guanylyltransferase/mannose-6-phosphate isomerase [Ammonifex degensii]ACX51645.1 mannose-1-phosphate guanylyltransferase/mannose-6-phosphate isomerase [Ammonifex degensii KC4]
MKVLILAGGKGTRLWPLSRELMPKQFIRLFDNRSLFQHAVLRALKLSSPEEIFVVTNREYRFRVLDDLAELGVSLPEENLLLEPEGKNTLPAICWGMREVQGRWGEAKVAVLPSDHLIRADDNFLRAFAAAEELAEEYLVTFGVKPSRSHAGYGYIKPGKSLGSGFKVEEFKEKPDESRAAEYVARGYYWNSGMYVFGSKVFFRELEDLAPEVWQAFAETSDVAEAYARTAEVSVEYKLMEKSGRVAVVPLETYWNDLGSFDAVYEALPKDEEGNAVVVKGTEADCLLYGARGNLVISERLTAVVGVEDLVIIDTGDALLVAPRRDAQEVKKVYAELARRKDERAVVHRTAYRPWGSYTVLEKGERYKIKRLTVLPGKKLSLQRHYHRSEHWVVVRGTARVTVDGEERLLRPGESTFIPAGLSHRLENPGKVVLELIETQIGEYLGEDDIERLEDDFGRS